MLEPRSPWDTAPPSARTLTDDWPTVLFSWWCTCFSAVIILLRLSGRKIRSNVLFREDWIMFASLIPLFIRMGLIHVVLIYGTNNVQTVGQTFSAEELYQRSVGSRLVLAARIFYAMFIWTSKLTVSEFLKRITIRIWRKSYEWTLQGIRIFLFITFFAVVIATLAECQPFNHYYQVVPDPGPQCRTGYAQLVTMGTCDIVTDILLVAFPIPIVLRSGQNWKRKIQLASLFSLSVIMIGITASRMPEVIFHLGRQQYRTVWASCEILASTAVSNAVILGSFLRDKGTKKNKYRSHSATDSIDRAPTRRMTAGTLQSTGSDEDLFLAMGCRVPDHLRYEEDAVARPAPAALPAKRMAEKEDYGAQQREPSSSDSEESIRKPRIVEPPLPSPAPSTKHSASFCDVGGLLENGDQTLGSRSRSTTVVDFAGSGTIAQDFAPPTPEQSRRGSRAFLSDMGGLLTSTTSRNGNSSAYVRRHSDATNTVPRHSSAPTGVLGPMLERHETQYSLQDAGGLLPDQDVSEREHTASMIAALRNGPPHGMSEDRPMQERPGTQQSLQDVGGLLSERHPPNARPAAFQAATQGPSHQDPDHMGLQDAGGLLR